MNLKIATMDEKTFQTEPNKGHDQFEHAFKVHHHRALFTPPHLTYSFNALEPIADYHSLKNHFYSYHMKSFEDFLDQINDTEIEQTGLGLLFRHADRYSSELINNAGCIFNHQLFWDNLSPHGGNISIELEKAIENDFGSTFNLKLEILSRAKQDGCGGWLWLIVDRNGNLKVSYTKVNANPMMKGVGEPGNPILAIDLWEHSFYTKFQTNIEGYIKSLWMLINWNEVSRRYDFIT